MREVTKIYGKGEASVVALREVNFTVKPFEMVAIIGASGSGKSTLLNIMGLLDEKTSGEYFIKGKTTDELNEKGKAELRNSFFGFVVQDFALIENFTSQKNIEIPLNYSRNRISPLQRKSAVFDCLKKLGIEDKMNVPVCNLSGGQRQRIAIARAIINNPELILADEPTGALDSITSKEIMQIFKMLRDEGKAIVVVTHNPEIAQMCDKTFVMSDGMLFPEL
jgi:putative ABC transport system ATP-binding protein